MELLNLRLIVFENYTDSLALPFLRLKLIILRPDFVFIRVRNPDVRTLFKRLPRNVLSVIILLCDYYQLDFFKPGMRPSFIISRKT